MRTTPRARLVAYALAVLAPAVTLVLRWPLGAALGDRILYMAFFPAIMLAAYRGGLWPGLLATCISALAADYFLVQPLYSLEIVNVHDAIAMTLFVSSGTVISGLSEALHRSRRRIMIGQRRYAVTLSSIGDAVIVTDKLARITFMNPVAEALTGWDRGDAAGRPLAEVFHIINEETRQAVEDPAAKVLRAGTVVGLANHTVLLARDGREVPIDDCGAPIFDGGDGITGVVLVFRDTTLRRQAEAAEAIRKGEHHWRILTETLPQLVWTANPDGTLDYYSTQITEYTGRTESELLTSGWLELLHPDDRQHTWNSWTEARAKERNYKEEHRIRSAKGEYRWFTTRGVPIRDAAGHIVKWFGTCTDITDNKRSEQALRENEHRWRSLTEALPQLVWTATPDGLCDYFSTQWTQLTGVPEGELLGWRWLDTLHPDDRDPTRQFWTASVEGRSLYDVEYRVRRSDGEYRWFKTRGVPIRDGESNIVKWFGTCTDVTTSKQLEEQLRHANARLDLAVRGSNINIHELNMPDGVLENGRWEFIIYEPQAGGYDRSDLTTDFAGLMALVHPDDRERMESAMRAHVSGETREYEAEGRYQQKDGSWRWFLTRGVAVRDAAGRAIRLIVSSIDITELKRVEEALRESEERFRGTFENAGVGIAHTHSTGRLLRVNEKFCAIVGYPREELLQKTFQDITHPDDLTTSVGSLAALMQGEPAVVRHEKRYVRKDGSPVWVELFTSLQRDAAGQPAYAIAVVQDISERKRLDAELRRAKEAAESANRAKDEFLANVSHEIRTPMNAILGMTDLVLGTPLSDDQRQSLRTVKAAADNLLSILNDLLDFSKIEAGKLELDPADFSLRAALGDTLRTLAMRAHKKGLELVSHVQAEVPDALVGDAGRLRQVLLNLIGNAIKFTEEGEVVVRAEVAGDAASEGVRVRFAVTDTGIGIPPEKQEIIFRAFEQEDTSTTRKYGGTGLGLTIAARLVALMGGTIRVDSEPGRGSTFAFTAKFARQSHPTEKSVALPPVLVRDLRVLVVDDNATNRHIVEEWLRDWQMSPTAVGDGVAAMDLLWDAANAGRPYPLVLLDARMPDTDGLALAARIRERAALSAIRIILLTSGDRPGEPARYRELRIDAHLLKPVQPDALLETIHRVMSRARGDARMAVEEPGREPAAGPVPTAAPLHVLVAEDSEFSARLLEQLLSRRGHRLRLATTGREALTLAVEGTFDVLLLDVHMPEMDGFEVVQAIRQRERTVGGHLPVIALTARSRKEDRERCLAAGMDDFLTKPVRPAELLASIDRLAPASAVSQPARAEPVSLLDPVAVLTVCGDNAEALRMMCQEFKTHAPAQLAELGDALRGRDAPRLSQAAHRFCPLLFAFSTVAGNLASELEDLAANGRLEEAQPVVERLETMARELMQLASGLSLEALQQQAKAAGDG